MQLLGDAVPCGMASHGVCVCCALANLTGGESRLVFSNLGEVPFGLVW